MISDQTAKRDLNRYQLLRLLQREGPLRRSHLSKKCGIRITSTTSLTDELIREGILALQSADRPRSPVTFTSGRWFTAVAAVTPDRIEFARIGMDGDVEGYFETKLHSALSAEALQAELLAGLQKLRPSGSERLFGVGVALTGIVDSKNGLWHSAIHFPHVHGVDLVSHLGQAFGCPVLIENEARASLWGALWFERPLSTLQNVVYLSLGSGIGSAVLINGELYAGSHFWAGELGHMSAGNEGRVCCCGKTDCLETYCSIPALEAEITHVMPHSGSTPISLHLADAIRKNPVAANVAARVMAQLGHHLGRLAAYVDPEAILLGEQEPAFYEALLPFLRRHIQSEFHGRGTSSLRIEIVSKPEFAPLRGIAAMVIHEAFQNTLSPLYAKRPLFTAAPLLARSDSRKAAKSSR